MNIDTADPLKTNNNTLSRDLEQIWIKIEDRFKSISQAFIFFDVNNNNRLSFADFNDGLEKLQIKFGQDSIQQCWQFLNPNDDAYISYDQFCALIVERSKLDPQT